MARLGGGVERAGLPGDASTLFIGIEYRSRAGQIGKRAFLFVKPFFVGVSSGSCIPVRLSPEEEHNLILHVEAGIIVDTLRRIGEPVADEDNGCTEIRGRGIEHWQKVGTAAEE